MPPKAKFTKEEVIAQALSIVRQEGMQALTARSLGAGLGSSARPIFTLFHSMEEVQQGVLEAANSIYQAYLQQDMASGRYPPYKASGMGYIRFAREEAQLFKLLFMRDRSLETIQDDGQELKPLIELIQKDTGLNQEEAYRFHLEMWIYVHGIATMIATSFLDWDMDYVSQLLTDAYIGLKYRYSEEGRRHGSH